MNNINKNKQNFIQPQIAGVHPADANIEFFGCTNPTTHLPEVYWIQHGSTHAWKHLPSNLRNECFRVYQSDKTAIKDLATRFSKFSTDQKLELFIYHLCGDLDGAPDIIDGKLVLNENFRATKNCPSLLWDSKCITIDGHILTQRELQLLDCLDEDLPDKAIAIELDISHSHLDTIKRVLYTKTGVNSKPALVKKAIKQKVI